MKVGGKIGDGQLPLVPERNAQVVLRLGIVRLQRECPPPAGERFIAANRGKSPARETARSTYSSKSRAIISVRPTPDRWLSECRPAKVSPGQVTTGTPIHKASQVVALPEKGKGSSATSTS